MNQQAITAPQIQLRDYQNAVIEAVRADGRAGFTRLLCILPTGCGKTIIFSELARRMRTYALILAHRDELIQQAVDKLRMVWPGVEPGIVMGSKNQIKDRQVICASVQTLARERRIAQIEKISFGLLVCDESHHARADTYMEIFERLGFMSNTPKKILFGCTATASRMDGKGLGVIFQKITYEASINTMIRAGYLAELVGFRAKTDADLTSVRTEMGDFKTSDLARAVNTPARNKLVVKTYRERAAGRKFIAFCVNVEHATDLADEFNTAGISARALSGKTPKTERAQGVADFAAGKFLGLINCALFTEGFDEPSIQAVLCCRPTKSQALYTQMIGRGTRKFPGKENCVIIDFCDNSLDVCDLGGLFLDRTKILDIEREEKPEIEPTEDDIARYEQLAFGPDVSKISIEQFDLLQKSHFRWTQWGEQWKLPVGPGINAMLIPDGAGKFHAALIQKGEKPVLLHALPLNLGYGQGVCEDYARRNAGSFARKDAPWTRKAPSEKQGALLRKIGKYQDGLTCGQASDILDAFFASKNKKSGPNIKEMAGRRRL